ncbi:C-terminal binding protein [Nocardiopsis flavescens]|uniref:C-terminal binding protein n=1 Tax=Nocardiopsis flavescens TaxID=758803 RepID=UPI003662E71A
MKFGIMDDAYEPDIERQQLDSEDDIICYGATSEDNLPDSISELDAVLLWHHLSLTSRTIDRLKKCKVIVRAGVGYDSVDCRRSGEQGIPVVNIPDYGTNDVADHCLSLILAIARALPRYHDALSKNLVENWRPDIGGSIHRITGARLGIVGFGRIGIAVAARARAFGMHIEYFDPNLPDGYDKALQVERAMTLEELFSRSDFVTVHAPLTDETRGLIDRNILRLAKPGLVLVNTARGAIVDLDAVYDALHVGQMKAFAADVLECEPPSTDYRLIRALQDREEWCQGRVLLTPHSAFYAEESRQELREKAAVQMKNAAAGRALQNCVNREFLVNSRSLIA